MVDFDRQTSGGRVAVQAILDDMPVAYKNDSVSVLLSCVDSTFNLRHWGLVAPHRVYGNGYHSLRLTLWDVPQLLRSSFNDFAAFVLATVRANAMRNLRFVAVGAFGMRGLAQGIVCAARLGPLVGVSSFRIGHLNSLTCNEVDFY
jgi:hypothetical protein